MKCQDCGKLLKGRIFYIYLKHINRTFPIHYKCMSKKVEVYFTATGRKLK